MSTSYFQERYTSPSQHSPNPASPSVGTASRGANALSSRITSVLSASYADLEIRDALETLDARGVRNTAETRRQLRLDVQKEVIQCNGDIVKDFGEVAQVSTRQFRTRGVRLKRTVATETYRHSHYKPESVLCGHAKSHFGCQPRNRTCAGRSDWADEPEETSRNQAAGSQCFQFPLHHIRAGVHNFNIYSGTC